MMAERQEILSISVVTDTETGQEKVGDIEGGIFDVGWLKDHLRSHGPWELLKCMAHVLHQIDMRSLSEDFDHESDLDAEAKYRLVGMMRSGVKYHERMLRQNLRKSKADKPKKA